MPSARWSAQRKKQGGLTDGSIEVALAFVYKLNNKTLLDPYSDFDCKPLCTMRYCCRASRSSPLNQYMSVSLKNVLKYPLLHFTPRSGKEFVDFIQALSGGAATGQVRVLRHQEVYKEKLIKQSTVFRSLWTCLIKTSPTWSISTAP